MGADFNCYTFEDDLGKDKIEKQWDVEVDESLYQDGHSYSGGIGMLGKGIDWQDKNFATEAEAEEYLCENQQKWNGAMAVSYTERDKPKCWAIGGWCSS